jgi:MYXO-CTERM domain-containing protein
VAQVTSGMREGEKPAFDQARVASDPFYNLAVGASILADKWQSASCIGSQNPEVLEHWYAALWRYNGYSYSNDPSNPAFSSTRGVWDPAVGGDAPYQEKVFGLVEKGSLSGKRWRPVALAYPRIEDVAGRTNKAIGEPFCASPTDCVHRRSTHRTSCKLTQVVNQAGDGGTASAPPGQRPPAAPAKKCGCSSGGEGGLGVALALAGLAVRRRRAASGGR